MTVLKLRRGDRIDLSGVVPWAAEVPPPALPVTPLEWNEGYVVRCDPDDVLGAMRAVHAYRLHEQDDEPEYAVVPPLHRVGWFRWNPCHESSCFDGGGHKGHLDYVTGPGRGNWRGVYFTW